MASTPEEQDLGIDWACTRRGLRFAVQLKSQRRRMTSGVVILVRRDPSPKQSGSVNLRCCWDTLNRIHFMGDLLKSDPDYIGEQGNHRQPEH